MTGTIVAISGKRQPIPVAVFANLRKEEGADRQLPLRLNIDRLEKDGAVRKGIPTLAVFLYVIITWHPIEGHPNGGCEKTDMREQGRDKDAPKK